MVANGRCFLNVFYFGLVKSMVLKIADIGSRGSIFSYVIFFSIASRVRVRNFFGPKDEVSISEFCVDYIPQLYVKFDFFEKLFFKI